MSQRETLHLVIVGHVDHGKSTLIGRLLYDSESLPPEKMEEIRRVSSELGHEVEFAYVMDHLEEERKNEMTIDTAQAFFKTPRRDYVIIDAPGHKELMKNMVTGASQAEAAILVLDAAEGIREQTQRHAYFIALLGIGQVVVLVNKMDKTGYDRARFDALRTELGKFLQSIGITAMQFIPGSASKGDNVGKRSTRMPWYSGPTVLEALDGFACQDVESPEQLRLPIQDVYQMNGDAVLVGRVESGKLTQGQELLFLPSRQRARAKEIRIFLAQPREAGPGECIGLVLDQPLKLDRGEVACPPQAPAVVTSRFHANVFWMTRQPCKLGEKLIVRAATQEIPCKVAAIDDRMDSSSLNVIEAKAKELAETEVARITFEAEQPIVLEDCRRVPELGRIVLARGMDVVGGALVTEV